MSKLKTHLPLLCQQRPETAGIVAFVQALKKFTVLQGGEPQPLQQGSNLAAGVDIAAPCDFTLKKGEVTVIDCGWAFAPPDGFALIALPRSSTGIAGLQICNTAGLLDNDYRGSVKFFLTLATWADRAPLTFKKGERFAQLKMSYSPTAMLEEVGAALPETERGDGGHGSSGA